jgi:hypothetical protein
MAKDKALKTVAAICLSVYHVHYILLHLLSLKLQLLSFSNPSHYKHYTCSEGSGNNRTSTHKIVQWENSHCTKSQESITNITVKM